MGGEWASGEILVAESWPKQHRSKVVGMVQSGWVWFIFAAILATFVLPINDFNLNWLPFVNTDFPVESWRVLFFLGVIPLSWSFMLEEFVKSRRFGRNLRKQEQNKARIYISGNFLILVK